MCNIILYYANLKRKEVYYHNGLSSTASPSETRGTTTRAAAPGPGPGYNEIVESWFDFDVWSVAAAARTTGTANCSICDDELPFTASALNGREHSGGTAFFIYGKTPGGTKHTQLTKPFIISEGYNLYDIAEELRKCNNPNNVIEDFFENINKQFYTNSSNFRTSLQNAGYDIVYIDNAKGTDDIVRNAHLFEDVVRWVNQNKVGQTSPSAEKNVVMGQSMGGLVSRYGLAEMAKRGNDDPHTRLLILHDSPQRGANNPVGVQSLTRSFDVPFLFGNTAAELLKGKIGAALRVLNQPATQQLSILNAFDGRGTIRANTFIPNIYQPMITFSGPAPYDIVAVSNGSQCGRGQSTPSGVALAESSLALLLPAPFFPVPFTSAAAGVTGEFASYGLPAYGRQATVSRADFRLEYRINIGRCPICFSIPIRFHLLRESATSPPSTLPLETLPGGSTNPRQEAGDCATESDFNFGSLNGIYAAFFQTTLYNGNICFVPSYSALDVPSVTITTAFAKYINNTTDNPSKPNLSRYMAQENVNGSGNQFNVPHITFTPRNSEWIFNEMQRPVNGGTNSLACSYECNTFAVVASGFVSNPCAGTVVTLSISNLPVGASVTWTALSGTVTSGFGPTFVTSPDGTGSPLSGSAAIVTAEGCAFAANFSISTAPLAGLFGNAYNEPITRPLESTNTGQVNTVGIDDAVIVFANEQGVTYSFAYVSGFGSFSGVGDYDALLHFDTPGTIRIAITKTTPTCGPITQNFDFVYDPNHGRPVSPTAKPTATLYPNPARETVDVHTANADAAHPVTVRLFDSYGQARAEQTSTGAESVRLKTDQLPAGLYFVHILRGKEVLTREQLRIEK